MTPPAGYTLNRPFWGMAPPITAVADAQYPLGTGIDDSYLSTAGTGGGRLFDVPGAPNPYFMNSLLGKIFNHITPRSNVFAIYCTVGFFGINNAATQPPQLNAEIGLATNTNIRHHLFAIVDRTSLSLFTNDQSPQNLPRLGGTVTPITDATTSPPQSPLPASPVSLGLTVQVNVVPGLTGTTNPPSPATPIPWSIQRYMTIVVDTGVNQESVVVQEIIGNSIKANFLRPHKPGAPINIPGNPGPQPFFDPAAAGFAGVVPYWAIID
jgi:hypothetical protein